jgi:DNA-binding transcriptional LysR family regulator
MYANVIDACHRSGFDPLVIAEVEQMLISINLVAAGVGISLVPASLREVRQDGIAYCPIRDAPSLIAPLTLVYRRGESRSIVTDLIALCVSHDALKSRRTTTTLSRSPESREAKAAGRRKASVSTRSKRKRA